MSSTGFGASVPRVEDQRFITGKGRYTDDIVRPGQTQAYILRSQVAHGVIKRLDVSAAKAAPGVVDVFVGADLKADGIGDLPCGWMTQNISGKPQFNPPHPPVAVDRVRHVGEPVAVIIAETLLQAKDAAELIELDIDDLPVVASIDRAFAPGAPEIWSETPGNIAFHWQIARDRARCRRRLRLEDLPLRRRDRAVSGRQEGRPPDQVDCRAQRVVPVRRPWPRPRHHAELALDKDGKFLALRVETIANMGAYLSTFASAVPTYPLRHAAGGPVHVTPAIYCDVKAVFTNTVPVDAYRGAGRPEATYVVERWSSRPRAS
jgi:CO/xanthine dehydrogenase Mo-binding subunit